MKKETMNNEFFICWGYWGIILNFDQIKTQNIEKESNFCLASISKFTGPIAYVHTFSVRNNYYHPNSTVHWKTRNLCD